MTKSPKNAAAAQTPAAIYQHRYIALAAELDSMAEMVREHGHRLDVYELEDVEGWVVNLACKLDWHLESQHLLEEEDR